MFKELVRNDSLENTYENDSLILMVWSQQSKEKAKRSVMTEKQKSKVKVTRDKHFWAIVAGFTMVIALLTPWDEIKFENWVRKHVQKTKPSERARRSPPRDNYQLDDVSGEAVRRYSTESWSETECGSSCCGNS